MGWAEIKKAINTNLDKALDTLITEKTNEVKTSVAGVQTTANAVDTNIGASGNTANSAGTTLFALIKYAVNTIATVATSAATAAKRLKQQTFLSGSGNATSTTATTIINISGAGRINNLVISSTNRGISGNPGSTMLKIIITIDGIATTIVGVIGTDGTVTTPMGGKLPIIIHGTAGSAVFSYCLSNITSAVPVNTYFSSSFQVAIGLTYSNLSSNFNYVCDYSLYT